jgi:uncharacterized protein YgiM (DUF1202 family)
MKMKSGLFFLLAGLVAAGCAKQKAAEPVEQVVAEEVVPETEAAIFGYPMRTGMWLYTIENDTGAQTDATKAAEPLLLGDKLQLVAAEPRKAVNPYDNNTYDYYHVRRDTGREGYVFANQLTVNTVLAVVIDEKANLYRSPKNIDVSDYILPRKILFGAFPETENSGFVRIEAYDPVNQTYRRNLYIKTSAVSYRDEDVQSAILLQTAEALDPDKEANRREALLDSALYDFPGSAFALEIQALTASAEPSEEMPELALVEIEGLFRVTSDNVNVRESPSASSRTVAQLANDAEVTVIESTADEFAISGQSARWFHITQPVEGWVFGAWLAR